VELVGPAHLWPAVAAGLAQAPMGVCRRRLHQGIVDRARRPHRRSQRPRASRGADGASRSLPPPALRHPDRRCPPGPALRRCPCSEQCRPHGLAAEQAQAFRNRIEYESIDLSDPYRKAFEVTMPTATLVADPFHVCKLANTKLDECRRRVQNETLGQRGRKSDPLYRCRRLLSRAKERLDDKGREKLTGLLRRDGRATWPLCGRPRRLCVSSRPTPIPVSHSSGSPSSATTSKTPTIRWKLARSGAPSSAGATRSPPGTRPTSPTDPPKR
jgi:hypothetical protein